MAIMTDIPTMPAPRSATPGPKGGAVAKGTEDGFQTALNDESLKQARNVAEKPEKEQGDELLAGAGQAVAAAAIGAANAPPATTPETPVAESDAPAPQAVDPAAPATAAAEIIPLAGASGEEQIAALLPEETAGMATPAAKTAGPALPEQKTVSEAPPAAAAKPTAETTVMPDPLLSRQPLPRSNIRRRTFRTPCRTRQPLRKPRDSFRRRRPRRPPKPRSR
jgi:hypothetical protein